MGNAIGRIGSEVILERMREQVETLLLQHINTRFLVIIDSIQGSELSVRRIARGKERVFVGKVAHLFFNYEDTKMVMALRVLDSEGEKIKLMIEKPAYRDISRTFERVYDDSAIKIHVVPAKFATSIKYAHSIRTLSFEETSGSADTTTANIRTLMQSFFLAAQKHAIQAKVIMFRARAAEYDVEKIAAFVGYPIIIPYPSGDASALSIAAPESIVEAMHEMSIKKKDGLLTRDDFIPELPSAQSQIIFPILYLNFCVGYILLGVDTQELPHYRPYLEFAEKYSYDLSCALEQSGYFDALKSAETEKDLFRLIDISASGLRFSYRSEEKQYNIGERLRLLLTITLPNLRKQFLIRSLVVHSAQSVHLHYVAVRFYAPDPVFSAFIKDYLYRDHGHGAEH